jgi:hypothetical protein
LIKNYNVKGGYYRVVTYIGSLIPMSDDDKPLTPNVGITIVGFFLVAILNYLDFGPFNARYT